MEADTDKATKVQLDPELECSAHCTQCPYITPVLEAGIAVWLWKKHCPA